MPKSSIVVYVLLATQNLLPIVIYSIYMTFRLRSFISLILHKLSSSVASIKSQSVNYLSWCLPLLPGYLSVLFSVGVIVPSSDIYIKTLSEAVLIVHLMLYFEQVEKTYQKIHSSTRKTMMINFTLTSFLFIMLWMKQIILFMDIIQPKEAVLCSSVTTCPAQSIVKLLSFLLNFPSIIICLWKMKTLRDADININLGIIIIIWYFLFNSIWLLFLFVEGVIQENLFK